MKKIKTIVCLLMLQVFMALSASAMAEAKIEVLAEMELRPGNPAVTPDGQVYVSMHPFDSPEFKIMRIDDGKLTPYPNEDVSRSFGAVIGIQATEDGTLWWIDMGGENVSAKLVGWDTQKNQLKTIHTIPKEVSVSNSFHQDFAIDEVRGKVFVADMSRSSLIDESTPGIVVIDLKTGATRRVLSGHDYFQPGDKPIIAEGKEMEMTDDKGVSHKIKLGLNPIAIDPSNEWVYFSTMTAGKLYRVPAEILWDFSKSEAEIEASIEVYADKPSSDGIAADHNGAVYITNVDANEISVADADGIRTWVQDDRLIWPDGVYVAPDGNVVVTVNQLNRAPVFNGGVSTAVKPYQVMRISK